MNQKDLDPKVKLILKRADKIALKYFKKNLKKTNKTNTDGTKDFFTNADIAIDNFLISELRKEFPDIGFVTEESKTLKRKEYNWIIDPLDGTKNFTRGIPIFAISVALWEHNKPFYGAISIPTTDQFFSSSECTTNVQPVPLSIPLINFAFHTKNIELITSLATDFSKRGIIIRNYYSIAFSGAIFMQGGLDALIMINQGIWDIASIIAITKNANIPHLDLSKKIDIKDSSIRDYDKSFIVAHDEKLLKKIATIVKKYTN